MSQQINLLQRPRASRHALVWLLLANGLAVLLVLGGWFYLHQRTVQLQDQLAQAQAANAGLRDEIGRLASAQDEATRIKAEIALLQPQHEAIKEFVANVRTGPLGRPEGYAPMLELLGQLRTNDAWLTSIELRHRGRMLALTGLALSDRAAGDYAAHVNRALEGGPVMLRNLELVRQAERQDAQSPLPATVAFKLN